MAGRDSSEASERRPAYVKATEALTGLLADLEPGTFLPSEPSLARELGISRATLREAMRSFEERGLVVRRQGVGTHVARQPIVIETGLEVLESVETLADRLGLEVSMGGLEVSVRRPNLEEAKAIGTQEGAKVVEIARVMLCGSREAAYLIDVLPEDVLRPDSLGETFHGSVLDLLIQRGKPRLSHSQTWIQAVSAPSSIARRLRIQTGDVLLLLEAFLYSEHGRVVDNSHGYFLPGMFRFQVIRRVGPT